MDEVVGGLRQVLTRRRTQRRVRVGSAVIVQRKCYAFTSSCRHALRPSRRKLDYLPVRRLSACPSARMPLSRPSACPLVRLPVCPCLARSAFESLHALTARAPNCSFERLPTCPPFAPPASRSKRPLIRPSGCPHAQQHDVKGLSSFVDL